MNLSLLFVIPLVCPFDTCSDADSLPMSPAKPESASADLSRATRLKDVVFMCGRQGAEWVSTTLRTITPNHRNLQQISLYVPEVLYNTTLNRANPANVRGVIGEVTHEQWLGLDRRFVQLWESHSIRPKLLYYLPPGEDLDGPTSRVESLLPEIMRRGIADLVRWG